MGSLPTLRNEFLVHFHGLLPEDYGIRLQGYIFYMFVIFQHFSMAMSLVALMQNRWSYLGKRDISRYSKRGDILFGVP